MKTMIRKIQQEDKETFLRLARQFYASEAVLHPVPDQYHLNTFQEMLRSDVYAEGYLFEADGETAGYGLISKTFSQEAGGLVIWLEELFLLPEYRSHGIGREFFRYLEENGKMARIRLEVEEDNVRAVALYEKLGYQSLPYLQMIKEFHH